MPTAAKMFSAVAFVLVGWWAAVAYIPQLPPGMAVGYFAEIMAALGFVVGWRSLGRNAGRGYSDSISYGLRTSFLLVFWALLGFAVYLMIERSLLQGYRGDVGKAVLDVPQIMMQYGRLTLTEGVLAALIIGGVIAGLLAEMVARRWK